MDATQDEISALIERFRSIPYQDSDRVERQLAAIAAPALPALLAALRDPAAAVRTGAAGALGRVGGPAAVAALTAALADPSEGVRGCSATWLSGQGDLGVGAALAATALGDAVAWVRRNAAESLGTLGDAGNVSALIRVLADEDVEVASVAALALRRLGWPGAAEAILTLYGRAPDRHETLYYENALDALDGTAPSAVPTCIAALSHQDPEVRALAVTALGFSEDPRAVGPLMALLAGADSEVRSEAAEALGCLYLPETADALLAALDLSGDDLRLTMIQILGWLGDVRAAEPLRTLKTGEDTPLERAVTEALKWLPPPPRGLDVEALLAALRDPDKAVRVEAARALGECGDARAAEPLLAALINPTDLDLCAQAAGSLGHLREPRAVEPLCHLLLNGPPEVQHDAAFALWLIGDARSTGALLQALGDAGSSGRGYAALALGRLQEPRAVGPLLGLLRNGAEAFERRYAVRALGAIGDPATRAALRAAWFDETFHAAQEALEHFGEETLCTPRGDSTRRLNGRIG